MKIAVVHEWLNVYGGSEKVTEELLSLFPEADLFALIFEPKGLPKSFLNYNIKTTFIQNLPFGKEKYQLYLPLMPYAYEELDMTKYDLVISSSTACAKGVITRPDAVHICYCHTPMRYAWDFYHQYKKGKSGFASCIIAYLMHRLRQWDYLASTRVDHFIANSKYVASRISKYYRRQAVVIHPPVEVEKFYNSDLGDFYLVVSRLVAYKRIDLAVSAFSQSGKKLVIIGDGPELGKLKKMATDNILFLGRLSDEETIKYYSECRAFLFPGEEDFGITPVEAQASGKPVIAFGRGGATETVLEGKTGHFFNDITPEALMKAVDKFECAGVSYSAMQIQEHAANFSKKRFNEELKEFVEEILGDRYETIKNESCVQE